MKRDWSRLKSARCSAPFCARVSAPGSPMSLPRAHAKSTARGEALKPRHAPRHEGYGGRLGAPLRRLGRAAAGRLRRAVTPGHVWARENLLGSRRDACAGVHAMRVAAPLRRAPRATVNGVSSWQRRGSGLLT